MSDTGRGRGNHGSGRNSNRNKGQGGRGQHRGKGNRGSGNGNGGGGNNVSWREAGGNQQEQFTSLSGFPPLGATPLTGSQDQSNHQGRGRGNNNNRGRGGGGHRNRMNSGPRPTQVDDDEDSDNRSERSFVPRKKRERKFEGPIFGFKRLYKFLETTDPNEVLLSINKDKEDWKDLLESPELTGDKLIVAIQVLGQKVCVDVPILLQLQTNALSACCSKGFTQKLEEVVSKISFGNSLTSRRNNNAPTEFPIDTAPLRVLVNIFDLCAFIMKAMPNNGVDYFRDLIMKSIGASAIADSSGVMIVKFKALAEQIKEITEKEEMKLEAKLRQQKFGFNDEDLAEFDTETPPDHIKDIEIIPSIEELRQTTETFLRPNKTTGAYNDCEHYLDVQFRLLREDFVHPLRKGIRTFLKDRHDFITHKKRMPLGEVRLYTNVKITKVVKERDSVVYKLQLSEGNYKRVKWDKSKRLLTGSLILITRIENSFQSDNTYFGVIFSRNVKELEKGIVTVAWEGSPPVYDEDEDYLMFESEVYLEAYRYTLDTLKTLELENFPMKKFIVEGSNEVEAPEYLKNATDCLKLRMADGSDSYISPAQLVWPTAEEFGLDENQMRAYKAAITKEFTIIQGPPGTGKTFLGLKVAETLLNNSNLWKSEEGNPITVVCYTNHALDQFLEGILKYYEKENIKPDIIRIGGRCKSEVLSDYSLRQVRNRNRRKLPPSFYNTEREVKWEIYELENTRACGMTEVTGLQDLQGIISFEGLSIWNEIQPYFPKSVWQKFENLKWFGIDDDFMAKGIPTEHVVSQWFQVRLFPKNISRKRNKEENNKEGKVERTTVQMEVDGEEILEDDEDYDLDELMDNRLIDVEEIFLEAETSQKVNLGQRLSYLPNCSIRSCEKTNRHINQLIQEQTKGMNQAQTLEFRYSKSAELAVLDNRRRLLTEIFRLYKGLLLDLPDVTELINDIREGKTVHLDQLKKDERWAIYFAVVDRARLLIAENVALVEKKLTTAQRELKNVQQYGDGLLLRSCKVVGLTTTGAAKYNNLLKMIKSKIVVVEEAAEVFESHIVTCITEHCEQLILIGDHRQLRPSPTVYDLAIKYHLDLSLFERMLNNKLHCHQLKMQHRMRPDISNLVRDTIYEELYDHDHVRHYPDVKGLTKNVYFITHTEKEASESDSMSKSNVHEAKFIAALCRHLVLQGYSTESITVLTMYTGQMFLLKKEVLRTCKGIRITCVDNFQGEENDIILLSLVRSNSEGKIGFLSIENRICVALSRAKHGLYVIGNMEMMEGKSKVWKVVKRKLEDKDFIGETLELECFIHRTRSMVKTDRDFGQVSPEGGCTEPCDTTLPCSHKCAMVCHVIDKDHKAYKCKQPCLKQCINELHRCKGSCYQECPRCNAMVERTLNCELQHKKIMPCYVKVENYVCNEAVEKTLPCGHKETMACFVKASEYSCKVKVEKKLPCGHTKTVECHTDPATITCKVMTPKVLPCSHTQNDQCWIAPENIKCITMVPKTFAKCGHKTEVKCSEKDKPLDCKGNCTTRLDCGHQCKKICHQDDDPEHIFYQCKANCARDCADKHRCKKKHPCYLQCPPCKVMIERVLPCLHKKELECHLDPDQYECLEKCQRLIPTCGHSCPNLCFQPCGPCQTKVIRTAPCSHSQTVICGSPALKQNCEVLVRPRATPACGHFESTVPCRVDGANAEELVKYCQKPCDHTFTSAGGNGCEHKCLGSCCQCLNGRIHTKCKSDCSKQLVCGHRCEVPCSAVCPPCKKPCLMKCEHTECKKKCGEPCSECKERCSWRCAHKSCTKLCGEMCDREPCDEPCPKKLPCGHDCVGFCGEPCPPLCRECNKEELTEILFGNEDEPDARFVYLADCNHVIEAEALNNLLNNYGSGVIKAKECPKCKTPIRNCRRFGNLIREFYKDVIKVKAHSYGNIKNSDRMRDQWISRLKDSIMERVFPQVHARIQQLLYREATDRKAGHDRIIIRKNTIDEFSMRSLDFIANSSMKAAVDLFDLKTNDKLTDPHYGKVLGVYRKTLTCMLDRQPLSRQEVMDFNEELDRVDYYKQLMMRRTLPMCNPAYSEQYKTYTIAKRLVASPLPLNSFRKETFLRLLKELDDKLRSGLGITDRERTEILKAIGMSQGHWFKCPNGHIYLITECGGAMVESRCNECGQSIGGSQHRLRADNQLATEMDGSTVAAWPTALQH